MPRSSRREINKRFNIVLIIAIVAMVINTVISYFSHDSDLIWDSNFYFFMSIMIWFFLDDEMLMEPNLLGKSFLVAIGCILYGFLVTEYILLYHDDMPLAFTFGPLSFLLVHWPLRRLFFRLYQRAPRLDKSEWSFPDIIYQTLLIGFVFLVIGFLVKQFGW